MKLINKKCEHCKEEVKPFSGNIFFRTVAKENCRPIDNFQLRHFGNCDEVTKNLERNSDEKHYLHRAWEGKKTLLSIINDYDLTVNACLQFGLNVK